jgi:hypothetical protein
VFVFLLTGCTLGPPSLPQPNGPMMMWNTGMWNTSSNATLPVSQVSSSGQQSVSPMNFGGLR